MITMEELLAAIKKRIEFYNEVDAPLSSRAVTTSQLLDSSNQILAENITSPFNVPRQNVSAMDGYALAKGSNLGKDQTINIVGESQAGSPYANSGSDDSESSLQAGQGVRIFTGAVVPDSCDTVVMQENTNFAAIRDSIDKSQPYATKARFPQADKVLCLPVHDHETLTQLSAGAVVAVMSHSLTQDRARLAILLTQPNFSYVGQLGPCYRTERLIKEIRASLNKADDFTKIATLTDAVAKLHYPIGYKLGGDGPEALALSIMAQISSVIHQQAQPVIDNQFELSVIDSELSSHTQRLSVEQRYAYD